MSDEEVLGKTPPETECAALVRHLCQRITEDADLFYLCGPGTEILRRLCLAAAEVTGRPVEELEKDVRKIRQHRPRSLFSGEEDRERYLQDRLRRGEPL